MTIKTRRGGIYSGGMRLRLCGACWAFFFFFFLLRWLDRYYTGFLGGGVRKEEKYTAIGTLNKKS